MLNTDNMSIIGLTIDYGPYGFLDYYDPNYLSQASGECGKFVNIVVLYVVYIETTCLMSGSFEIYKCQS